MAFKDLRSFIAVLQKHEEVQVIDQEVDWNLEAGAILRRTYELSLPAPYFKNVKGYPKGYEIFGGAMSTIRRVAIAMEMDPDTPASELAEEYIKRKDKLIKPVLVDEAACKENIFLGADVDLFKFPAPMVHEGDGGRYILTWAATITKDPDTGWVNWGVYRAMIHNRNTLGGMIEPHKHIGYHYYPKYENRGKPMPFAMAIGTEPICMFAATARVGPGVDEVDVAGAIRGEPVELVKCETVDLEVPASSEIVFEGEVLPYERIKEGPFGEFTGYRASPRDDRPVFRLTAITHRNNPILAMSCMGVPIDDCHAQWSISQTGELLAELRTKGVPVKDVAVYPECAIMMAAVSVKPPYAGIADRIAHIVWGTEAGNTIPYILVLEDDIDVYNLPQVFHALATKCHPYRGITRLEHTTGTALNPFANRYERLNRLGAKAYFDCTWPLDWDPSIAIPPRASFDKIYPKELQHYILQNWANYGYEKGIPEKQV